MEPDENEEMMRRAVFGKQVDNFISSQIGQYMLHRAREQRCAAQDEFKKVSPNNAEKVAEIQNTIMMADNVENWLRDAVGDGLRALNILEDRE